MESSFTEFLTPEEIRDLTQARGLDAQVQVLEREGIPHKLMRRRLLVSRFHVREWLTGKAAPRSKGINLAMVR